MGAWMGCADDFSAGAGGDGGEVRAILFVVVADQEARMLTPWGCFAKLLSYPGIRGTGCDGRADDPARRQLDDDED